MHNQKFKNYKLILLIFYLIPYIVLYSISRLFFDDLYLFKWMSDRIYLCIWIVVLLLAYTNKYWIASFLTFASIAGVIFGQFLGDFIRFNNIKLITSMMAKEEQARLYLHQGVPIWILTVFILTLIGIALEIIKKKRNENYKS